MTRPLIPVDCDDFVTSNSVSELAERAVLLQRAAREAREDLIAAARAKIGQRFNIGYRFTKGCIGTLDEVHDDGMAWLVDMADGFDGPTAVCEVTSLREVPE